MGSCSGKDGLQNLALSLIVCLVRRFWKMDSCGGNCGIRSGFTVRARTVLPVTMSVSVNFPAKGPSCCS